MADVERGLSDKGAKKMAGKTDEAEAKAGTDEDKKGGKKKLLLIAGPVVLVILLAVVYLLFLKPSGSSAAPKKVTHIEGVVVPIDAITINLAGGHFLKLGMALQADASAGKDVQTAQALDLAIELFSGKTVTELSSKEGRDKAKEGLTDDIAKAYKDKVYEIYFTEFVYQ
jgi:flagellar FliL protein